MPQVFTHKTVAFGYESLTVSNTAKALTSSKYKTSIHTATVAFITVEDAQIRYRYDGTNPTASEGHLANPGDVIKIKIEGYDNIKNFKAIRTGSNDATLRVTYEE